MLAGFPSCAVRLAVVQTILDEDPGAIVEAVGRELNRRPTLSTMPLDLEAGDRLEFEDLAGLFASTSLDHGVVGMTVRQVAYVFGLARRSGARSAIEIGRWRGGCTIALAAAMGPRGTVWSIDTGEKERRIFPEAHRPFDEETLAFSKRFGLDVRLLVGDSRELELGIGDVDMVLVDGDHSYEGVRSDFERFGRKVRVGGHVLLDDAYHGFLAPGHPETVGRVVEEVRAEGDFRERARIDRLAHLERVR